MKVVAYIEPPQGEVIEKILRHCGLWNPSSPRAPPADDASVHDPDEPPELTYVDLDPLTHHSVMVDSGLWEERNFLSFLDILIAMPHRSVVAKELAVLLGVLAHPQRVRIVEELRGSEHDVNSLQAALGISHSGVSQHLTLLRARRIVVERRQGRQVFYRLRQRLFADWLTAALRFIEDDRAVAEQLREAIARTQAAWAAGEPATVEPTT